MSTPNRKTPSPLWKSKVFLLFSQLFTMKMSKHTEKLKGHCNEHPYTLYLDSVTVNVFATFLYTLVQILSPSLSRHIYTVYTHIPLSFFFTTSFKTKLQTS